MFITDAHTLFTNLCVGFCSHLRDRCMLSVKLTTGFSTVLFVYVLYVMSNQSRILLEEWKDTFTPTCIFRGKFTNDSTEAIRNKSNMWLRTQRPKKTQKRLNFVFNSNLHYVLVWVPNFLSLYSFTTEICLFCSVIAFQLIFTPLSFFFGCKRGLFIQAGEKVHENLNLISSKNPNSFFTLCPND